VSRKAAPGKATRRQRKGQLIALVLASFMALSLATYYFGVSSTPGPAPSPTAGPAAGDRYVEQGNRAYDTGDYAAAIRYYEQALSWRERDPAVLTDLGTAYFYRTPSDPDRAIAYYDRALAVSPGFRNALFNKGIVLLSGKRDPAGASASWEQLLTVLPAGDPAIGRVKTLIAEAKAAEAKAAEAKTLPAAGGQPENPGSRLSSEFGR
jgi:tetratricopeptide (TPR) repeat protein